EPAQPAPSQQFLADLQAALRGVPSITIERISSPSTASQMAFLSPISLPDSERPGGVVVGWTDLRSNLILSPMIEGFRKFSNGTAFVTDDLGNVLIQSGEGAGTEAFDLDSVRVGEEQISLASDGTRQLVYVEAVKEYSWYVVVIAPLREVHRRAFQITFRLGAVLVFVGSAFLLSVYAASQRLTKPLKLMADIAQSIARGSLDHPIPEAGEDEIGQFASAFERMRRGLKARMQEMGLLLEVSQRVTTSFELTKILPPILKGAGEIAQADVVRVALAPQEKERSLEGYQAGEDPGNWATLDSQVLALSEAQGRFTLENPARASAVLDLQALTAPIEALTALPIKHEDSFVGVLWLGHRTPYGFAPDEINLLSILAGQLGVAIANARLFQRAERERLRLVAVLESTPEAVIVVDPQGRISLLNPAAVNFLEVSEKDAVGNHVTDVITNSELSALLIEQEGGVHAAEVEMGRGRVCFASVSEIHPQGAETSGRVCVLWDVTHYKKLDTLKSEFVSTVSHDLRAPLTLMRGYATMLSMVGDMNEQQRDFLRRILTSVDQMSKLVDNLLDLGRIEAGMGLSMSDVQIEPLLEDVMESYRPQAVSKQIAIDVTLSDDMKPIEADPTLLRQAIANLMDNALKYTPANGKVTIRADQRDGYQTIAVQDTGVGIAPTDRARLFERFYRVRGRESLGEQGLGLGLAIVKSIVEQHSGRILVESKLGQGSTFTIILPMRTTIPLDNELVSPPAQEPGPAE
ncbi:MAG: HAMP domain-containing protein, partial [Anaerolineales bacterium]|nr:HAMP domain-containing protein [Anaerolineales bacterium]